ncbi:hypothetical protein SAMN04487846_0665 [Microbacterium sp. cf046]|uniref:hypothetical protein n=1 Tax=Microbacterium sp. cf046 TaxID=1761803 RepID=UPI0008E6E7E9|nr:hypothetical protein [Microbacterium sp. cf046]SFR92550.1 hypothetical protein SAMN04487846_0665 [Microbacterium sp. cf046]
MKRWLPALALLAVLTGCASAGSPPNGESVSPEPTPSASASTSEEPGAPVPRFVTPDDDGQTYGMTVGQTTTLRIDDPDAPEPDVEGESVLLIQIVNVAESGTREWEVRAVEPGEATVSGVAGDTTWAIVLRVAS